MDRHPSAKRSRSAVAEGRSPAGTTPPLTQLSLSEGTHTVTVRNADFPPFVATVTVVPGQGDATTPGELTITLEAACDSGPSGDGACMGGDPGVLFESSDGGVYRSDDCTPTWERAMVGLHDTWLYDLTGNALAGNEPLAGMKREDIVQKMLDFKNGRKPATVMHQLAKGYSDEQIAAIAGYFAAQKKGTP